MDHKGYWIGYINIGANDAGGVWTFNRVELTDKTGNWSGIYRDNLSQILVSYSELSLDFTVQ